jgi:hypothetical protein
MKLSVLILIVLIDFCFSGGHLFLDVKYQPQEGATPAYKYKQYCQRLGANKFKVVSDYFPVNDEIRKMFYCGTLEKEKMSLLNEK